jgi:hypothetical protein
MATPRPAIVEDESDTLVISVVDATTSPPITRIQSQPTPINLSTFSSQLSSLAQSTSILLPLPTAMPTNTPMIEPPPSTLPTTTPTPKPKPKPTRVLSTLSSDAVIILMHHEGVDLPTVCPCDTINKSVKKTNWTLEELHWIMGCCKF